MTLKTRNTVASGIGTLFVLARLNRSSEAQIHQVKYGHLYGFWDEVTQSLTDGKLAKAAEIRWWSMVELLNYSNEDYMVQLVGAKNDFSVRKITVTNEW